jgi:uncharacterized membrane protein (DUF485 family)
MSTETPVPAGTDDAPGRYVEIARTEEFHVLRRTFRRFVFPAAAAFLAWYALYVLMSAYARDFMDTKVVGHINVALVFGLLQFVSTFVLAWLYARYADRRIDPLADALRAKAESAAAVTTAPAGTATATTTETATTTNTTTTAETPTTAKGDPE